jgi:molecular chaperone DnaK (HSP70)
MPVSMVNLFDEEFGESLHGASTQTNYGEKVKLIRDRLEIDAELMKSFFHPTINNITRHLSQLLSRSDMRDVDTILMVGGFSECSLVQEAIRRTFHDKRVIIPAEAGMAVLKGAVIFGHQPSAVSARVVKYTYGCEDFPDFNPRYHPPEKRIPKYGRHVCRDVFSPIVDMGTRLASGESISHIHEPISDAQTSMTINIFVSTEPHPEYTTDRGCSHLGRLTIPLPPPMRGCVREVEGRMMFGDTELLFEAKDLSSGRVYKAMFDCLE